MRIGVAGRFVKVYLSEIPITRVFLEKIVLFYEVGRISFPIGLHFPLMILDKISIFKGTAGLPIHTRAVSILTITKPCTTN